MSRNLRSRGRGRGKEPITDDLMDLDYSPDDVEMQDPPPEALSRLRPRKPPSSQAVTTEESPFWTDPSHRTPLPESSPPPAPPRLKQPMTLKFRNDHVGEPPGFVRGTAALVRETGEERWKNGVLSGSALIRMLEDLSRSTKREHWQVCALLDGFAAKFGRFHTPDGLIVADAYETYMLMLARKVWVDHTGEFAGGDVLWVPGLEPRAITDPDWEASARQNLPELPIKHYQPPWLAAENQYMHRVMQRPQKGEIVYKGWVDDMKWERDIREGEKIDQGTPSDDPVVSTSNTE
ncbi:uncharacterized protein J4E79_004094 [Alternaria viburni]|uniref:uncharacterized protein n=1 Tax=Alternaria viburni TaxID=566460 RepID=UPI0020C506DF|nr:uncharacterized protein J4E79_004094 [Alternaria viburni]KAI4662785.1 hypothetical protein J4E79_004094 [Alternaria viburni]